LPSKDNADKGPVVGRGIMHRTEVPAAPRGTYVHFGHETLGCKAAMIYDLGLIIRPQLPTEAGLSHCCGRGHCLLATKDEARHRPISTTPDISLCVFPSQVAGGAAVGNGNAELSHNLVALERPCPGLA
jgi:hypothetical protein